MTLLATLVACQGNSVPLAPSEVRDAVARQLAEAGINASQVEQASGLFKPVELTPEEAPDWLVDFKALPSGRLCGTGGCPLQIWVKRGKSSYALAFDRQVLGYEVASNDKGRRWLAVDLHGVLCGGTGSVTCKYQFEWQGAADALASHFAAASIGSMPARYEGPLVQAMPVQPPEGSPMANALNAYRAACMAVDGTPLMDEALALVPDLNRDGSPELLFDAGQADCQRDDQAVAINCAGETCRSQLFSNYRGQGWRAVWSGEPFVYAVDLSGPEPRLMVRSTDCDEKCPEQSLVWQDDVGRFARTPP